jgi:hypothetical protein
MEIAHEEPSFPGEVVIGVVSVLGNFIPPVYLVFNHRSGYPFQISFTLQGLDAFLYGLNICIQTSRQLFDESWARMVNVIQNFCL